MTLHLGLCTLFSDPNAMCEQLQLAKVDQHCSVHVNGPSTLMTLILGHIDAHLHSIQDKYFIGRKYL